MPQYGVFCYPKPTIQYIGFGKFSAFFGKFLLEVKIKETEAEIADRLDKIPDTLKEDGYPDVQIFMRTFREMESVVEQYNRDLAEWEYQVSRKPTACPINPPRQNILRTTIPIVIGNDAMRKSTR